MPTDTLFHQNAYLQDCMARIAHVSDDGLVLERTVFYPRGGGQAGDSGWLTLDDGTRLHIADTRKAAADAPGANTLLHVPAEGQEDLKILFRPGEQVHARIDWERRYRHMRLHTAAHMLCAILPYGVNGCSITAGYARLDFVTDEPLSRDGIDAALARLVEAQLAVSVDTMSDEALRANPELVRTMRVQPPMGTGQVRLVRIENTDLQPCGGTHVLNTREVGLVHVSKIEKKSARARRVVLTLD
ncbi:MAG: alanyl-tRNA editing protein [Burkholderiaceae bacterium]|nr:alanyl-tRNA editing protein [Burkholderiaceae bacterium]